MRTTPAPDANHRGDSGPPSFFGAVAAQASKSIFALNSLEGGQRVIYATGGWRSVEGLEDPMLYYVRGRFFTCGVITNEHHVIIETAPLLWRFRGQPVDNLLNWRQVIEVQLLTAGGWRLV